MSNRQFEIEKMELPKNTRTYQPKVEIYDRLLAAVERQGVGSFRVSVIDLNPAILYNNLAKRIGSKDTMKLHKCCKAGGEQIFIEVVSKENTVKKS